MFLPTDYRFMAQALRLAEKGLYSTSPNPRVGCVLVRDRSVVVVEQQVVELRPFHLVREPRRVRQVRAVGEVERPGRCADVVHP